MKLFSAGASPYVAKVAMTAAYLGVEIEMKPVNVAAGDAELDAVNPISKIPTLLTDDGMAIYDSRIITRYVDRVAKGGLYPTDHAALTKVEVTEALLDGLNDAAVAYVYEMRMRPEEKVEQSWLDRQWNKATRAMDAIMQDLPPHSGELTMASLSLGASLGYLDLRHAGRWEKGRESLVAWRDAFAENNPQLAALKPSA